MNLVKKIAQAVVVLALATPAWAESWKSNQDTAVFGWSQDLDWTNLDVITTAEGITVVEADWSAYRSGEKPYDVVLVGGHVMDPQTSFDGIRNVGIVRNRIVTVTEGKIEGVRTIDVSGHVVAPGFIDTHIHGQTEHSYKMYLRDGMTTSLSLENGSLQIAKFYDDRVGGSLMNHGTGVSHEFARIAVMDGVVATEDTFLYPVRAASGADGVESWNTEVPTSEQLSDIYAWLHKGMREGALMMNSMPGYIRDTVSTSEIWEIQKIAAEYGRGFGAHPRFGPFESIPNEYTLGYKEVIANAAVLNQPILLSHNNNLGWEEIVDMTNHGRKNGMTIWAEQYPYTSGGPNAGATILDPDNMEAMGFPIEDSVLDPSTGEMLTREELEELRVSDAARPLVAFLRPKEWVNKWVATPELSIVADSFSMLDENSVPIPVEAAFEDFVGHPRAAGTRGKSLRIAREDEIDLMLVVNNAGAFPAKMLCASGIQQMCYRGKIQDGMIADITVFDPQTVTENSDYGPGENGLPTTGIPYVLVSGQVVVDNSVVNLDIQAGVAIRYNPITE